MLKFGLYFMFDDFYYIFLSINGARLKYD